MRYAYFSLEKASYSERGQAKPKVTQIILKFQKAKTKLTTHEQHVLVLLKSNDENFQNFLFCFFIFLARPLH